MANLSGHQEILEAVAEARAALVVRIDRLAKAADAEQARRDAARKQQVDNLARQVIAVHDAVIEQQIAVGIRKARPVRKAGMTLTERLQEIVDEAAVEKRRREILRGLL